MKQRTSFVSNSSSASFIIHASEDENEWGVSGKFWMETTYTLDDSINEEIATEEQLKKFLEEEYDGSEELFEKWSPLLATGKIYSITVGNTTCDFAESCYDNPAILEACGLKIIQEC